MKKIKLGIDIDDTLTDLYDVIIKLSIDFINKNNINPVEFNQYGYEASEMFGFSRKLHEKFKKNYLDIILYEAPIRLYASEVISALKQKYEIIIITNRSKNTEFRTIEFLNKNNIYYDKIVFDCNDKGTYCGKNKISIMIDDNVANCKSVVNNHFTRCLMFHNNFNIDINICERVYSWYEIYLILNN